MKTQQPSLFSRHDTFFGVCEALGEDFRFNANILRVALGLAIFWNPVAVLGTYAVLGVLVLLSRKLFPVPQIEAPVEAQPAPAAPTERFEEEALPLAA